MKTYLINNECIFIESKHELKNISNSIVIRMTAMRARCLRYIIENANDELIERKALTTELWGERGDFVNDANLTQILYLIRRDLKSLGIQELFVTIPRRGIQVNNLIPIRPLSTDNRHNKKNKIISMLLKKMLSRFSSIMKCRYKR